MKFSVLFAVGANCVRPRAFTERPYEDDFLSAGKTCFNAGRQAELIRPDKAYEKGTNKMLVLLLLFFSEGVAPCVSS